MVWKRGVPKHMVWKQTLALNEIGKINQKDKQPQTQQAQIGLWREESGGGAKNWKT